jgi:hypothetical protein
VVRMSWGTCMHARRGGVLRQAMLCMHAGGVVVCCGRHAMVELKKVRLQGCALVALGGAQVAVAVSSFLGDPGGICLFAHGRGTSVTASACTMHAGLQAVAIRDGAVLQATNLQVRGHRCPKAAPGKLECSPAWRVSDAATLNN